MHVHFPRIEKNGDIGGHEALPLIGGKQQSHENKPVDQPEKSAEKVPVSGNTDGMPKSGQADPRGNITAIVFGGPHSVLGHHNGGEADPFRTQGAVVAPIKSRMIHENREAATDQ